MSNQIERVPASGWGQDYNEKCSKFYPVEYHIDFKGLAFGEIVLTYHAESRKLRLEILFKTKKHAEPFKDLLMDFQKKIYINSTCIMIGDLANNLGIIEDLVKNHLISNKILNNIKSSIAILPLFLKIPITEFDLKQFEECEKNKCTGSNTSANVNALFFSNQLSEKDKRIKFIQLLLKYVNQKDRPVYASLVDTQGYSSVLSLIAEDFFYKGEINTAIEIATQMISFDAKQAASTFSNLAMIILVQKDFAREGLAKAENLLEKAFQCNPNASPDTIQNMVSHIIDEKRCLLYSQSPSYA